MSILVQYLRKLDVKIIHVIPAEGVPVDSHTHTHTHTYAESEVACQMFGWKSV